MRREARGRRRFHPGGEPEPNPRPTNGDPPAPGTAPPAPAPEGAGPQPESAEQPAIPRLPEPPAPAASPQGDREGKAQPAGRAPEILAALRERLFEMLPGWAGRPEDPANVLLEVVAETLAGFRGDLAGDEERRLLQLLEGLGFEPRPPRPARGAVIFTASHAALQAGGAVVVPPGAEIVAARGSAGVVSPPRPGGSGGPPPPRVVFETVAPTRVGSARLARAVAVDGIRFEELPLGASGADGGAGSGGVSAFGPKLGAGRELFLGDDSFLSLRADGASLRIDWPGYPRELSGAIWEYRVENGWRALPARFERTGGETPALRMLIEGPLPDLVKQTHLRADLPWIRCRLPAGAVDLAAPALLTCFPSSSPPEGKEDSAPAKAGREAGRRVARVILSDGEETADFSFDARLEAPAPHAEVHAAVYFGWDGPSASSLYLALGGDAAEAMALPGFAWEYSRGSAWAPLDRAATEDRTRGLSRNGVITLAPPASWEARELFGDRLWWVRGRWVSGERARPVVIRAIIPGAAEVLQGRTVRDLPLARASEIQGGDLALPALAEGEIDVFDRLEFRGEEGKAEVWHRVEDLTACGASDPCFALRRATGGGWRIQFGDGVRGRLPPVGGTLVAPVLRVGIGAQGNLSPGALNVLAAEVPGIESVENPLPTSGGEDAESPAALRTRARAEWRTGGRAVTAADFDLLARMRLPGLERAAAVPDPRCPGGLLVVLIPGPPREPGRFPPALLRSFEADLAARAPLGTPLRVVEPSYLAVEAEVSLDRTPEDLEGLRRSLAQAAEAYLDPIRGGVRGQGFPGPGGLAEDILRERLEPALGGRLALLSARLLDRDRKPLPYRSTDWPADLVLKLAGVRLRGE